MKTFMLALLLTASSTASAKPKTQNRLSQEEAQRVLWEAGMAIPDLRALADGKVSALVSDIFYCVQRYGPPETAQRPGKILHPGVKRASWLSPELDLIDCRYSFETYELIKKATAVREAQIAALNATPEEKERLRKGQLWFGMTTEMAQITWGPPGKINRTILPGQVSEQWVYYQHYNEVAYAWHFSAYLYFTNGKLTAVQN